MITAGIDVGALTAKAVIVRDGVILSHAVIVTGVEADIAATRAMNKALENAGLSFPNVEGIAFTGSDRESVSFAGSRRVTEVLALAKGVKWIRPTVRTAIDVGAESTYVIRLDAKGRAVDFITNDKCAAGSGTFLETVAKMLQVPLEKIGELSLTSLEASPFSSMCVVLTESEVVSYVHRGVPINNILAGVHESMVNRIFGMLNRVGIQEDVVMAGGVAKNIAIVKMLEKKAGLNIITPSEAQIIAALGAALIAGEKLARAEG